METTQLIFDGIVGAFFIRLQIDMLIGANDYSHY